MRVKLLKRGGNIASKREIARFDVRIIRKKYGVVETTSSNTNIEKKSSYTSKVTKYIKIK